MDVQVDEAEWIKYRETARDLSRLAPLTDGLLADLARMEVAALDLMPLLRGTSPGAFLDDDPHLSPKGHEAFASALVPFLGDSP
jgi:lysophospholipase L1-like esterase